MLKIVFVHLGDLTDLWLYPIRLKLSKRASGGNGPGLVSKVCTLSLSLYVQSRKYKFFSFLVQTSYIKSTFEWPFLHGLRQGTM